MCAFDDLAIDDQSAANARPKRPQRQSVSPLPCSTPELTESRRIRIIPKDGSNTQSIGHHLRQGHIVVPWQIGRLLNDTGTLVGIWCTDPYVSRWRQLLAEKH